MADIDTGVVATSSITLSDIYDVVPVSAYVKSNQTLSQLYNPADNSYQPDYTATPLTMTVVAIDPVTHSESSDGITTVVWSYQYDDQFGTVTTTDTTKGWYISGDKGEVLNIKENFASTSTGAVFNALVSYKNTTLNTTSTANISTSVSLRNLVKSSIILNTYSSTGYNIVNSQPSKVILNGDLYINGVIDTATSRTNDWFRQDTSVTSTDNPLYDSRVGLGWAKILSDYTNATPNSDFDAVVKTNSTLSVVAADIINVESYRLITTATEGEHANSPQQGYYTAYNFDSAFVASIQTPDGTVFKNGTGSKHLKGTIYNTVGEVDPDGTMYAYKWYVYKSDGSLDTTFGGTGSKSGKTILIDSSEIDDNSQLTLEVSDL